MVVDNIIVNKSASIARCLKRIQTEYNGNQLNLFENLTKQDSIVLNLQRACELSLDLGLHVIRVKKLGIPQSSRDIFEILNQANLITPTLLQTMKAMVGFRNIAIHEYRKLNLEIIRSIIEKHLSELNEFVELMKKA